MDAAQAADLIQQSQYINFVTFRKNGDRKATPIWVAPAPGGAYVWTNRDTWKVKRLRANPACELIPCNVTGSKNLGPTIPARLVDIDMADKKTAKKAFRRKYGLAFTLLEVPGRLRPGSDHVYIHVEFDLGASAAA